VCAAALAGCAAGIWRGSAHPRNNDMMPYASAARGIAAALVLCVGASASGSRAEPKFDGRNWTVGNHQESGGQRLTEYVLPGETVDNWKELVTSTVYPPVPIEALVDRIHALMSKDCPSLVWNTIQQDERAAVFEWYDAGCGGYEPQVELDRLLIQSDGLYRLAYAVKMKGPLEPKRRKQWLDILTQVPLAEGPPIGSSAAGKTLSTEDLAAGVRRSGLACPAGVKSEVKNQTPGPVGPLTHWILECSNGAHYSVLVDPSGSMTTFQTPK
jgi:hypothetical protein